MSFWWRLTAAQRGLLRRVGTQVWYEMDDQILRQGERDQHVVVLLAGMVKVVTTCDNGLRKVLAIRGAGSLLGEIAALTEAPRTAAVCALSRVAALLISIVEFEGAARADPRLHDHLARELAERLRLTNRQLIEASLPAALPRLAALLASLGDQLGTSVLPISQPDLASLAGTSDASVARSVRVLRQRGMIRTGRRRIELIDTHGLRKLADTYDSRA